MSQGLAILITAPSAFHLATAHWRKAQKNRVSFALTKAHKAKGVVLPWHGRQGAAAKAWGAGNSGNLQGRAQDQRRQGSALSKGDHGLGHSLLACSRPLPLAQAGWSVRRFATKVAWRSSGREG